VSSGALIWRSKIPGEIESTVFSRDSSEVLIGNDEGAVRLCSAVTGKEIRSFQIRQRPGYDLVRQLILAVGFSYDGRRALAAGDQGMAETWDLASGRELAVVQVNYLGGGHVALSPNAKYMVTATLDAKIVELWDLTTGKQTLEFKGDSDAVQSVAVSPDGRHVVTAISNEQFRLWDISAGGEIRRFGGRPSSNAPFSAVAFSPDGRYVLTAEDHAARLWDVGSGRQTMRFARHTDAIEAVAFSPDGRQVVTTSHDATARLWDPVTGEEQQRFVSLAEVYSVALSPNGRQMLAGGYGSVRLFDVLTAKEIRRFHVTRDDDARRRRVEIPPLSVAFSPDGNQILTTSRDMIALWDVDSGTLIRTFDEGRPQCVSAVFSPDGQRVLAGGIFDVAAHLWDVASGKEIRRFEHPGITAVRFSPDGRWVVTSNADGTLTIWPVDAGKELVSLVSFHDGGWAVADSDGRYDAFDPDHAPGLYWVVGDEVIELYQLKERFYAPGLLARIMGFRNEPLRPVVSLKEIELWPEAKVQPPPRGGRELYIHLRNRGGGIGKVVVKVNGREISADARGPVAANPQAGQADIRLNLSGAQLRAGGNNEIEVITYGGSNLVASRAVVAGWHSEPSKETRPMALYAIVVGTSRFPDAPGLNLTYAAKDAMDIARALTAGARRLFQGGVYVRTIASDSGDEPTKPTIRSAFEDVASRAGPDDVLVLYFAGHGVAGPAGSDTYYYLTSEATSVEAYKDPTLLQTVTISSRELRVWLTRKGMPLKEVIILDTCAAGSAGAELLKLADRRELTGDQRRAIELLKDASGSHILMGSAADRVSYEASRYAQGLLTYALLLGMKGESLENGGLLQVRTWFDHAQQDVPTLAEGIGGIQKPVVSSPYGMTFPIGLLAEPEIREIPLGTPKVQLLRVRCEDENYNDPLHLEKVLSSELRNRSRPMTRGEQGSEPGFVYLDQVVDDVPDAYRPQVIYRADGSYMIRLAKNDGIVAERKLASAEKDTKGLLRNKVYK
jgi:WD40 repeat protein/uncharacterized caspase-like protein